MATVYAVASAKGGVGKTTTTAAIATTLADAGADVVAVDADIGMANLAEAVGVEPGEITLHDVLSGRADPIDAVRAGPAGLRVVPGAADLDAYAAADPSGLREVVAAFDDADYVFLDAGAGLSHDSTLPLGLADETLLVSTAERSALGDTEKTRQLTERLGGTVAGAAITRVGGDGATDDEITRVLDATVLGRIPDDPSVLRAATANEPLVTFAPDAPATRAYRDLARALTGAEIPGATGTESESTRTESGSTRTDPTEPEPSPGRGDEGSGTETEREGTEDESSDGVDTLDGVEPSDEAGSDGGEDSASTDTEDIIIADAGSGGLGEPTGERDIIVADESPAPADESDADPGPVESAHDAPERDDRIEGLDTDTRTVGNDRVDADDLESMIEDEAGDAAFDPERESPAGDESTGDEPTGDESTDDESTDDESTDDESTDDESTDDEPTGDESAGDEGASDASDRDIDDELAGSVPFRDDDTGTMNTVLSEQSGSGDQQETTDGSDEADDRGEGDEDDGTDGDGFFSRLFGR